MFQDLLSDNSRSFFFLPACGNSRVEIPWIFQQTATKKDENSIMKTLTILLNTLLILMTFGVFEKTMAQEESQDTITIQIELPNGVITRTDTVAEGDTLMFSGLPFPLHIMNGGELEFPEDAVSHDITITIEIPRFAEVDSADQNVSFGDSIASAINFNVSVDDSTISPYEFDSPLTLKMSIPEGLPHAMSSRLDDFVLAFVDSTGQFNIDGINTVEVDSVNGLVTAEVSHFSTVAMTTDDQTPTDSDRMATSTPQRYKLDQNYPNPFNPVTRISYEIPEQASVTLTVYNVLGQNVATLVNETQRAGRHEASFDASDLSSGVYIYRLEAGDFAQSRTMMLVK